MKMKLNIMTSEAISRRSCQRGGEVTESRDRQTSKRNVDLSRKTREEGTPRDCRVATHFRTPSSIKAADFSHKVKEKLETVNRGTTWFRCCVSRRTHFRDEHKPRWFVLVPGLLTWSRNTELCCGSTGWTCPISSWSASPSFRFCTRRTF